MRKEIVGRGQSLFAFRIVEIIIEQECTFM